MPTVGKKKYPYTAPGIRRAIREGKEKGLPVVYQKGYKKPKPKKKVKK